MRQYKNIRSIILAIVASGIFLSSCDSTGSSEAPPPINMGDPATIVTETDSQYLTDLVTDLNMTDRRPVTIAEEKADTAKEETPTQEEDKPILPSQPTQGNLMAQDGLKVPFPQVTMFIPKIETRTYQKFNFETAYGASYEITDGELDGNYLVLQSKGEITDVYVRHQSIIVARNELGMLPIESLKEMSEWKKIKGDNGVYKIDEVNKLVRKKASNKSIRNAVDRAARERNWSAGGRRQWVNNVRNVKSTSQKPLAPELRAIMWKVIGKDENGRPFQRQLRIDVPIKAKLD